MKLSKTHFLSRLLLLTLVILFQYAVQASAQTHKDWSYNLGIYEVNVRQYTEEGTFEAFRTHLERLEAMGVGILWIMPINPIGQENRIGSLGSYYSVQDYFGINPEFGTMDDFKALVEDAHNRGMYVIIDWVANHTSWDNVLTETHPEWYVKDGSGNFIPPPGTNWSDVIELDYSKQGLRDYQVEALKFWVDSAGVDGFRFDAVTFVPDDFWTEALSELKSHKQDIFLLAEGDGYSLHQLGFDMTFGWGLYGFESGVFHDIADGSSAASALNIYAAKQRDSYKNGEYRMFFTSNHDINSWEGTTTSLFGDAADVFAVITATFHGMPLIYSGQEAGLDKQLQFFDKDEIEWKLDDNLDMYIKLLDLKRRNKALWNGDPDNYYSRILTSDNNNIFAFLRTSGDDSVFVVTNLSDSEKTITLSGTSFIGGYDNVFTGQSMLLTEGQELTIPAWGFLIFEGNGMGVGIDEEEGTKRGFNLEQNYPNPFNPKTVIGYELAVNSAVELKVYDTLGREVATLVSESKSTGKHSIEFEADNLPTGIYIYTLSTEYSSISRTMLLIK